MKRVCGRAARVLDAAALVMRAVAEGGASAAAPMREAALAEGALLTHLLAAVSGQVQHTPSPGLAAGACAAKRRGIVLQFYDSSPCVKLP